MRYPAAEKLEIIRRVERAHLPVRRILDKLGIAATPFYRCYEGVLEIPCQSFNPSGKRIEPWRRNLILKQP